MSVGELEASELDFIPKCALTSKMNVTGVLRENQSGCCSTATAQAALQVETAEEEDISFILLSIIMSNVCSLHNTGCSREDLLGTS